MNHIEIKWIVDNEFKPHPNYSFEDQTEFALKYLGSPDTLLREGALEILDHWIFNGDYSDKILGEIASQMEQNLLVGLGENNTDTVFIRSFSALILAVIVDFDEKCALETIKGRKSFLTRDQVIPYLETCLKYFRGEKDVRGYIKIKEWAHSISHGAEFLRDFSRSRLLGKEELLQILDVLKFKITEPSNDIYAYHEDIMISTAVYTIFKRNLLNLNEILEWMQSVADKYLEEPWYFYLKKISTRNGIINTRFFFQSFYFMVKFGISQQNFYAMEFYKHNMLDNKDQICSKIEDILHQFDRGVFYHQ